MQRISSLLILIVAVSMGVSTPRDPGARTELIEQSFTWYDHGDVFEDTFVADRFDPALGELIEVRFVYESELDVCGVFTNWLNEPASGWCSITSDWPRYSGFWLAAEGWFENIPYETVEYTTPEVEPGEELIFCEPYTALIGTLVHPDPAAFEGDGSVVIGVYSDAAFVVDVSNGEWECPLFIQAGTLTVQYVYEPALRSPGGLQ